ncbi:alpha/beta fold hydrolase [Methylobacterium sp. 37f]|uniref:alpha/beta fold hydrolase n=1 Tax=Methylobacterium sp. 37f TaxID=2817058 RepID=UPI001FFCA43A|nr:alpha/beta fold hydrolase [Methylobacterium sp. 37f]
MKTLFLPGASGSASFWRPVATQAGLDGVFFGWPGLGAEPPRQDVDGLDDLVALVATEIREPVAIVAQSMGGIIAIKVALAFPDLVKNLVLTVTSGGVPMVDLGGSDWRPDYFRAFPRAAKWIADPVADLSSGLPSIRVPVLLLWGDSDSISPVAVGKRLAALLPNARLCILLGANHDLAQTHVRAVADEIRRHLMAVVAPQPLVND